MVRPRSDGAQILFVSSKTRCEHGLSNVNALDVMVVLELKANHQTRDVASAKK